MIRVAVGVVCLFLLAGCNHRERPKAWSARPSFRLGYPGSPNQVQVYLPPGLTLEQGRWVRHAANTHWQNVLTQWGPRPQSFRVRVHGIGARRLANPIRAGELGYEDGYQDVHVVIGDRFELPSLYHHLVHRLIDRDPWHQDPLWRFVWPLQALSVQQELANR